MGYLFLSIALIAGATKGYCGKRVSSHLGGLSDAALTNFIRMIICTAVGLVLAIIQTGEFFPKADLATLLSALLSGVATASFIITWVLSVRRGSYVMIDVFLMLGVGVTLALSLALGEKIKLTQILGFVILIVAAYIMCSYNKTLNGKMSIGSFLLLILCGASSGLADFGQKLFTHTAEGANAAVFNFYSYLFSTAALLITFLIFKKVEGKDVVSVFSTPNATKVFIYVSVMAVMLFVNSYFKTLAAEKLDAALLYPLNQGLALISAIFIAAIFFKEKVTVRCIVGVVLAFIALIIINVL